MRWALWLGVVAVAGAIAGPAEARDRLTTKTSIEQARIDRTYPSASLTKAMLMVAYGSLGLGRVAHLAGMRDFTFRGVLFEAGVTAGDQARFSARIDRLVPRRHRAYALRLLGSIVSYQRWGVPPEATIEGIAERLLDPPARPTARYRPSG